MIHFLQNSGIDKAAWDACITNSGKGMIYGMSWYLDLVSPGWCALEQGNYSVIMPLPVKKKYSISYIIQPVYAQQLGIFSIEKLSAKAISDFIEAIPPVYRFMALNFNSDNPIPSGRFSYRMNANYELALHRNYPELVASYQSNTRRNIQKASDIVISFDGNADELLHLKTLNTAKDRKKIPSSEISRFISTVLEKGSGFICSASSEGQTCAAVFFLQHKKRIYYLIPVSNTTGKEKKAMFAIVDKVIQKYAGTETVLDFEGSNIPGIARFFERFGALNHPYPSLVINRLPFPLNQFRKI